MPETLTRPTVQAAVQATNQHYELPPALFASFLDARLKYSSGLYTRPGMSLDEAQTEKLHLIAKLVGAKPGCRLLDIGCGWGSLTLFMAAEYGCRVTAVTPSQPQASYIAERARATGVRDPIELIVGPFFEVDCAGPFDAVTMVGSINHMPNRHEVIAKVYDLLRQDGALYISESCFRSVEKYDALTRSTAARQVSEDIFGFGEMVPLSTLLRIAESAGLSMTGVTDLTWHFERTVVDWIDRVVRNRETIENIAPGMFAPLLQYLETTNAAWGYTTKQYALTAVRNRLGPAGLS